MRIVRRSDARSPARIQLVVLATLTWTVLLGASCAGDEDVKPFVDHSAALDELAHLFQGDAVVRGPELVECRLSAGTETSCFSLTLRPEPSGFTPGPWCPRNISDGPEKSGIWLDKGKVHDADGPFIEKLDEFYDDDSWQMYDASTGSVRVTDSREACAAAARPDVDPKYQNYCVECQTSYMEDGATMTYVIPLVPVPVPAPTSRRERIRAAVGIAFSGVRLDAAAPVEAILGAHTLAPFDDCGGHVNLHAGYHLHAVTDCLKEVDGGDGHAAMLGVAMDGYRLFARLDKEGAESDDLDSCGGHEHGDVGYHYHVADPGKNRILACHAAESGCASDDPSAECDATRRGPPR